MRIMLAKKFTQILLGTLAVLTFVTSVQVPVYANTQMSPKQDAVRSSTPVKGKARWERVGNNLYRIDSDGYRMIGYFTVDGKMYYAHENGVVREKTGWFKNADGNVALVQPGGIIKEGFVNYTNKFWYLDKYGQRRNGHFKGVDGYYYFTKKGRILPGWNTSGAKTFYVLPNGRLAIGKTKIGNFTYDFDAKGVLKSSMMTVTMNGQVVTDTELNILSRIVAAEVGGFDNIEVFKAQAIAARSWIVYLQSTGVKAPSVLGKPPTARIRNAVREVQGMTLTYKNKVAFTPYYAFNNGSTNASGDLWDKSFPYLKIRASKYDKQSPNFETTKVVSKANFIKIMDKTYGKGQYVLPADQNSWIKVNYNKAGYAKGRLQVGNRQPTAEFFYQTMMGLRSPAFKVSIDGSGNFIFTTQGWGHGVGMSQRGAFYLNINKKFSHRSILKFYYPGTVLKQMA